MLTRRKSEKCFSTPMRTSSRSRKKPLKIGTKSRVVISSPRIRASSWIENASVRRTFHCKPYTHAYSPNTLHVLQLKLFNHQKAARKTSNVKLKPGNHLHIASKRVVQITKAIPVVSAQRVDDRRETVGAVLGYFCVNRLRTRRVSHTEVVLEKLLRYHILDVERQLKRCPQT